MMETNKIYSIITLLGVVCLTSLGIQAAPPEYDVPVVVNNDATNPVPVIIADPVPVTIADPVSVSTGGVYRYAGTTIAETLPNVGLNGMNDHCRAEFGNESRMCSTKEFFQTPDTSAFPINKTARIYPILLTAYYDPIAASVSFHEWTGKRVLNTDWEDWETSATCLNYANAIVQNSGMTLHRNLNGSISLRQEGCNTPMQVTCCTPQ